jgi:WD40 repeat protein
MCTAATNGKIVIWNIEKAGIAKQERIYDEHGRTVNRVCWHPSDPMIVLSASQDSSIKLWDIREASSKLTMQSKAGPSRDVMWMPTSNSFKFAAAFETGVVQIWDIRDPKNYEIQLTGNQRDPILTIAWHPTQENIIASGSRDKLIKVWNVQENSRVPFAEIQTMQSLARVKWRPNHPTQLASCSMLFDNRIHIWDYKNPYIPVASFIGHTDVVTGFVWGSGSGEEIISCGKDSTVRFFGFNSDAYLPQKYLQLASVSWRAKNDLCFINDSKR